MMFPYMTLADETEITYSHLIQEKDRQRVEVHFERPVDGGFHTARCSLPDYTWLVCEGYSQEEIHNFEDFLHRNAHLFYRFSQNGGMSCA